jgi:riboflavin kinase/FMN adenylyltransferase
MRVLRGFLDLAHDFQTPVVSIGNFDGVHLGHQAAIESVIADARKRNSASLVCTFDPHTRALLKPNEPPSLMQTLDQRLEAISALGVDGIVVIPFDERVAAVSREDFVGDFLCGTLNLAALHVSRYFRFGRLGAGDVAYLRDLGTDRGFDLTVVPETLQDDRPISSSWVRQLIREGDMEGATRLLGRPLTLRGDVGQGGKRGREMGAPTANLLPENGLLPPSGVYVTRACLGEERLPAVTNIGTRPTFGPGGGTTIEAHLLDYRGDLYGHSMDLEFLKKLREEIEFPSADELASRIQQDVALARAYFNEL